MMFWRWQVYLPAHLTSTIYLNPCKRQSFRHSTVHILNLVEHQLLKNLSSFRSNLLVKVHELVCIHYINNNQSASDIAKDIKFALIQNNYVWKTFDAKTVSYFIHFYFILISFGFRINIWADTSMASSKPSS